MARWFISRFPQNCDEGELEAYRVLNELDDNWTIRWCYDYLDGDTPREGDFLILGPDGRLLVLEVKRRSRAFASTGYADGNREAERDEDQVQAQKAGVIAALQEKLDEDPVSREMAWTVPAIFSARDNTYHPKSHGQPFAFIGGSGHLRKLPRHWEEITSGGYPAKDPGNVRNLFHAVYGDASPEAEARFISETDRLLIEKSSADISLLEALSDNSQLLVHGGPGSGKTWMAERHAVQLASQGMHVLFLCFNKALGASLTRSLPRLKTREIEKSGGKITVRTWEDLCEELGREFAPSDLPKKPSSDALKEKVDLYYAELSSALLAAVTAESFHAPYDALIVDEAQDHRNDWWEIYFSLLTGKKESQMGIYYDPAQRPTFMIGDFDIGEIALGLPAKAHLRLLETRRYTRPIFEHLRGLHSPETERLIGGLHSSHLLAGPDIIFQRVNNQDEAKARAGTLLREWFEQGLVSPEVTLLLLPKHPFLQENGLFSPGSYCAGLPLISADDPQAGKKGYIRVTSFNKAKGLDARAVVILDTPAWEDLAPEQRYPYWMASSRARQMLAVISN
jgi:hypothetical protein